MFLFHKVECLLIIVVSSSICVACDNAVGLGHEHDCHSACRLCSVDEGLLYVGSL